MTQESTDKKKGWSLSLNATQIRHVESLIARHGGGDRTEFTLEALDCFDRLSANNPDLLLNLAAQYHPSGLDELEAALKIYKDANPRLNQARMMIHFLDALTKALSDPGFKAGEPFELVGAIQRAEWESVTEERLDYIAQRVIELQQEKPRQPAKVKHRRRATGQPELVPHPTEKPA